MIVLALLKSGRTFSGMLLWHGAQMRLRSLACGLGPQTFATGPASSVLQLRARERALAAILRQTAEEQCGDGPEPQPVPVPLPGQGGRYVHSGSCELNISIPGLNCVLVPFPVCSDAGP